MSPLPLQDHIAYLPVTVKIQDKRLLLIGVCHHISLADPFRLWIRPYIKEFLPPAYILLHRLPVKEDYRHILIHGLVNDHRRRRPIHHINADHVTAQGQKTVYLAVLCILIFPGVYYIQDDPYACVFFIFLCLLLQHTADRIKKGIILSVKGNTDAHLTGLIPFLPLF